ncbi:NHL-repeat-containing protein 4 [Myotis lucifugus]|uniref:NHL-repeat-containing protein 4 n=1 Tax=Myotis lucifugus TaxID=59463 RepID=UPI0006D7232B|nr:NHL-repeat-containing protein 4 [Myotis lucifugus]
MPFLVTDYVPGAVQSFTLGPTLELLVPASRLGLEGPCWVGLGSTGAFCRSACQPLGSLGGLTGHGFGSLLGVATDSEGNAIVADKQQCQAGPFPWARTPFCMVFEGLGKPSGMASVPQSQLMLMDAGASYM